MRYGDLVPVDALDLDQVGARRLVELGFEADDLARIGVGARRLARRLRVGQVLRDDAHALRLRLEPRGRDLQQ